MMHQKNVFFNYNEGLRRRFVFKYDISGYDFKELGEIFIKNIKDSKWCFDKKLNLENNNKLLEFFKINHKEFPHYGGDMETLLFSTKITHSIRIFGKNPNLRKELIIDDLINGFELFKETRKGKSTDNIPFGLYI